MKRRKTVKVLLTLSVAPHISAAAARREVRTLINDQCNYSADEGDVRAKGVRPASWANLIAEAGGANA